MRIVFFRMCCFVLDQVQSTLNQLVFQWINHNLPVYGETIPSRLAGRPASLMQHPVGKIRIALQVVRSSLPLHGAVPQEHHHNKAGALSTTENLCAPVPATRTSTAASLHFIAPFVKAIFVYFCACFRSYLIYPPVVSWITRWHILRRFPPLRFMSPTIWKK